MKSQLGYNSDYPNPHMYPPVKSNLVSNSLIARLTPPSISTTACLGYKGVGTF